MPTVLLADDERNIRATLARALRLEGYATLEAADGREALDRSAEADALLLDLQMPGLDGLQVLEQLRARGRRVPAVVLTAHGSIERAVTAVRLGAFDFIEKPPSIERVLLALRNALALTDLQAENRRLSEEAGRMDGIVGASPAIEALRDTIARVAPTDASVLVLGENGTGKELVARAIHAGSRRAARPLVVVNGAAVPETLFESELFGHQRGAFTGATEARRGKFQQADGGTLFLDEIGEVPLPLQPKLLRALESGEVERVGGKGPETVDVRVVAATNRDLSAEVAAGRFRPDLFYRLNVVPVRVPPLRERRDDLPALAAHLLEAACRRNRLRPRRISPRAFEAMRRHDWPGNVRELRNVLERAAILGAGEVVEAEDLALPAPPGGPPGSTLADEMARHERAVVLAALERTRWRMSRAAEELGLERSHLYKKLRALGIDRPVED